MDTDRLAAINPAIRVDDRLTVRHRLDDGSATDVMGWVVDLDPERVTLQPASATPAAAPVVVARDRIILAKRIPPAMGGRSPARVSAEELQRAALPGWVADSEPLGHWTVRLGNGFTGRANSCLAVGDPDMDIDRAAAAIIDRYTAAGLPPRAQVILDSPVDRQLRESGWTETYVTTTVMTHSLADLLEPDPYPDPERPVRVDADLTEDWWQGFCRYRPVSDPRTARRILTNNPPVGLASILGPSIHGPSIHGPSADPRPAGGSDSPPIISLGRGQVTDGWLGISGLWTEPDHRRRGLATMIIRGLGRWAARRGARSVYLQVARDNAGAIAAYRRLGFTAHHDYCYLAPPDSTD